MNEQFVWADFYKEFANKLLGYKNDRAQLIEKVKKIFSETGINMPTLDIDNNLVDIDPFTMFALFNKKDITKKNRTTIITEVKKLFNIKSEAPTSFDDIPTLDNQNAVFYRFNSKDKKQDIDDLWKLFESALNYSKEPTADNRGILSNFFDVVINKKYNGNAKITMGLFWIAPDTFLNFDSRSKWYIYESEKIPPDVIKTLPDLSKKEEDKISAKNYFAIIDILNVYLQNNKSKLKDFKNLSSEARAYSEQINEETKRNKKPNENNKKKLNTTGKDSDDCFKDLLSLSKKYYKYAHDDEALMKAINDIPDNIINELLDNEYSESSCVGKNENAPVNTLRHITLCKVKKDRNVTSAYIEDIKNKIKNGDVQSLRLYFDNDDVVNSIKKRDKDPFERNYKTLYSFFYTFFYRGEEREKIVSCSEKLSKKIINDIETKIELDYEPWSFDGPRNTGRDCLSLAIYPKKLKSAKYAYQIHIKFCDGICSVLRTKGSELEDNKEISDTDTIIKKKCSNYNKMIETVKQSYDKFVELNNEIVVNVENNEAENLIVYNTLLKDEYSYNRIIFGAPGTGKSYKLDKEKDEFLKKYKCTNNYERVTFHPDYCYANFVGTYKPVSNKENDGTISYKFVPGPFMRMYVKALRNARTEDVKPFILIIEEINRANVAAVFGDIFQLLDRDEIGVSMYPIQASEDIKDYLAKELGGSPDEYLETKLPNNLFIWATMNSADQGVFPMDTAFKRRWDFTYIGIDDADEDIVGKTVLLCNGTQKIEWNELRKAINDYLAEQKINEDKQLGPYFISRNIVVPENGDEIDSKKFIETFKNKVIMYLFEDAAKQKRTNLFSGCDNNNRYSSICAEFDKKGINIFDSSITNNVKIITND